MKLQGVKTEVGGLVSRLSPSPGWGPMGALPRVEAADGGKWMDSINSAEVDVMG